MSEEAIERSFVVTPPVSLVVANIRGSIHIQPSVEPILTISATKHLNTGDPGKTTIEITQEENGLVKAITRKKDSAWAIRPQPCEVDYTIYLPCPCQLSVNSVSSRVEAQGLQGEFILQAVNGNMVLKDLSGLFNLSTVSGRISGERLIGPLELKTVSGDIALYQGQIYEVHASTVSGNLTLETLLGRGPYNFSSLSGNIQLITPADTNCNVDITSTSGTLKSGFSTTYFGKHGWHRKMMLQDGGPEVQMNTVSGNLWIVSRKTLMNLKDPLFNHLPRQRQTVMDRISKGELTVEDGINILTFNHGMRWH